MSKLLDSLSLIHIFIESLPQVVVQGGAIVNKSVVINDLQCLYSKWVLGKYFEMMRNDLTFLSHATGSLKLVLTFKKCLSLETILCHYICISEQILTKNKKIAWDILKIFTFYAPLGHWTFPFFDNQACFACNFHTNCARNATLVPFKRSFWDLSHS